MNAPWSPARNGGALREPFTAFVCDELTAEQIRPVVVELGWAPDKVNKGGLRNAVQSLSVSASPQILFVDLSESGDPLNDINALAEVCEPGTVVIAAGQVNDVRLYRDLVASGIQDYLLKPFSADQLREAFAHAQTVFNAPKQVDASAERPHVMAAVIGARGGAGASTVATSIAWLLGEKVQRSTALLDLDVHFGTGALTLDLEPGRGLTDAIENPSRIDGLFIERAMVKANEKLAVLSAEAPINQPMMTDGAAFFQLQEELRTAFECTIIDLPRGMLVQHPHLMSDVQATVITTELTLASARDVIRILSWLKTNASQSSILVVANKVATTGPGEISRKDFEASIERKLDYIVPLDMKVATQAAKLGKTVSEVGKGTRLATVLLEIANRLIATVEEAALTAATTDGKPSRKSSLLGKISGITSMLPKKSKQKAA
ncbi:pilus assembly protein CpaE [Sphingomonas sp.]|uniref:pilus assembly protein CpaE n=1 Tax=Sphingomonas sp. TaxID=28214 RepID=UPI0025FCEBD3|nr:pilus assembly protein CpaE [Sphingomonas sp.]